MAETLLPEHLVPIGINGSGRMAKVLLQHMMDGYGGPDPIPFLPKVVNFRSKRDIDPFSRDLEFDPVYGGSDSISSAIPMNGHYEKHRRLPGKFFEEGLQVVARSGLPTVLHLTAGDNPKLTEWSNFKVHTVFEATGSKANPRMHVTEGGAKLAIVTAPFEDLPTFVSGVNDDESRMITALRDPKGPAIAASSCSTGAITTAFNTLLRGGIEITSATAEITHARTQSDYVVDNNRGGSVFHTHRNSTGAQKEVARILAENGYDIPFIADSTRVLEQTGSVITPSLVIRGAITTDNIIEAMREAIEAHKLRDHIAIEERHSPDSLFVKGRPETVIIDAASIQTVPMHGDTLAMFKGWFDNEWGYVANTLRLATKAHQLMREM